MQHTRRLGENFKEAKKGDDSKKVPKAVKQLGKDLRSTGLGVAAGRKRRRPRLRQPLFRVEEFLGKYTV